MDYLCIMSRMANSFGIFCPLKTQDVIYFSVTKHKLYTHTLYTHTHIVHTQTHIVHTQTHIECKTLKCNHATIP